MAFIRKYVPYDAMRYSVPHVNELWKKREYDRLFYLAR